MFKVGQFLTKETTKALYYTLVYPCIHYCNVMWTNNYPTRLSRIVILQKRAVRTIAKIQFRESTHHVFMELKLLKVQEINKLDKCNFLCSSFIMINYQKICQTSFHQIIRYIVMVHDMQMTVTST